MKREGRWGFVDRDGQEIVAPRFDTVEGFSEGRAAVTVHEKWGYVDRNGHLVIEPRYEKALPFRQGIACVTESETAPEAAAPRLRSSYIDAKGNVLWSAAHDFCDLRHDERPCIRRHRGSAGW